MDHTTSFPAREFTVKETAAEMRKALKSTFPGVRLSVRMDRGTAHGWIDVSYTDGPTGSAVTALTDQFRSERFDGMDDMYYPVEPQLVAAEGELPVEMRYSCCGVLVSRYYSEAAEAWALGEVQAHPGRWHYPNDPVNPTEPHYYAARRLLAETDFSKL